MSLIYEVKQTIDISIIITAWKEPKTVSPLISEIEKQVAKIKDVKFEILLVCPDEETKSAGLSADCLKIVRWIRDDGVGKPSALNKVSRETLGNWWIMTDGDVLWKKNALQSFLGHMDDDVAGALTGHPISINDKNNMLGYWSHLLTEMAHRERLKRSKKNRFIVASGYLMAIRKGLIDNLPANVLSDDALISYLIINKNFQIRYVPEAKVLVKFPTNFADWIKQKARSGGGYTQLSEFIDIPKDQMRSFTNEIKGLFNVLGYARSIKEFFWTIVLLFARLYLWLKIFWERKVMKKSFKKTWTRIESTK